MLKILQAGEHAGAAYHYAATAFQNMYQCMTGIILPIITKDDGSDLIVIGSDSVNSFSAKLHILRKARFRCVTGSDSYHIFSMEDEGRKVLVLAGGRGRSTIYAVYRYFEVFCGCRYFWDGDVIPGALDIPMEGIDLAEAPRFIYRGIRYFAHRSLHRFQAEHWGWEDWKKELDWLLKKRLNLFMLRIGNDDLFQCAFPDIVEYPSDTESYEGGDAEGYNDRTTAWSLRYRGELRKKILTYAFDHDLMHPEDCGTMTHWYSRTPKVFLEAVKPTLLNQTSRDYKEQTGLVWDITEDRNLDLYFKLTEAHIREFGKPEIFHTIGLAERNYSADREENMALKTYAYHRIAGKVAADYPDAKLLIAGWDLAINYTPEEVDRLLDTFDPNRTILFDYTSDSSKLSNFTNWNTVGRFPWIFGIFHGYECDTEMRGWYPLIEERLHIAKEDSMCCGFVLWPELSHSDTFMLEYLADNAWAPLEMTLEERIEKYCLDRYGALGGNTLTGMHGIWKKFWPIMTMNAWSMENKSFSHKDIITDILFYMKFQPQSEYIEKSIAESEAYAGQAAEVLRALVPFAEAEDAFLVRDVIDIARTVLKRYIQYSHRKIEALYVKATSGQDDVSDALNVSKASALNTQRESRTDSCVYFVSAEAETQIKELFEKASALVILLAKILGQYEEYSLEASFRKLAEEQPVNPAFEKTLLKNASCQYCRTQIYELIWHLFIPEQKLCFEMLTRAMKEGVHPDTFRAEYVSEAEKGAERFIQSKLEDLKPKKAADPAALVRECLVQAADMISNII